jgi:hypothetical protein
MKSAYLFLAAIVVLATTFCSAQTIVDRLYIMRSDSTVFDPYMGMTHTCVLVYPDGRYRFERSFQGNRGGNPETKIYLDTLPEADFKALQAIIDDSQFQQIKTAPLRGGIVNDMDTLSIIVPREHEMQNINFTNAADRKPFEKTLKPFQNALKNLEKRKVAEAKQEKSDNCNPPQVMYRSTFRPGQDPMPDNNPQQ